MLRSLWPNMVGYLTVFVSGSQVERFINLCLGKGFTFWDMRRPGNGVLVNMNVSHFFQIRPLVRKTHVRIHITRKKGLPFAWKRLQRRQGFFLGALLFFAVICYLSTFIWHIEVRGLREASPDMVIQAVNQLGLKVGAAKSKIDPDQLENALMLKLNERITWVGINVRGTRAIIEVVERVNPVQVNQTGDIIAKEDGVISRVLVVSGQQAVQEGETVSKGMLLIRGSQPGTNGSQQAVKANGQVLARVWREEFSTVPLYPTLRRRTGQVSECRFLNLGGKEIIIKGKRSSPYPVYDQQVTKREVLGRISHLTVEMISVRYYEVVEEINSFTWDQAQKLAEEQVTQAVEAKLPANARVIDRKVERIPGHNPDEVKVRILIETLEDIGVFASN